MTDKDFDFISEEESEIATSGNPKEKEESTQHGGLTPEIIKEARRLSGSPKGLEISTFFIKHQLIGVNLDNLLYGKLDKDGNLL